MVARAALILTLAVAGCAGDDDAGSQPDFGQGYGTDLGTVPPPGCAITLTQSSSYPPAVLMASTAATFPNPRWTVALAGSDAPTAQVDPTGRSAIINADSAGTYTVTLTFANGACSDFQSLDLLNPTGATQAYRLRALPPPGSMSAPTDTMEILTGGTPLANRTLKLDPGTLVGGTLTGPAGAIAGEIRFVGMQVPDADTRAGANGLFSFYVSAADVYRPLLIPDSPTLAPHLGDQGEGYQLSMSGFVVTAGAPISGSVSDGTNPIAGAGVVLRAGLLPSGLGTSASDGSFSLRAEALSTPYQLGVSSDGWPTLTLDNVTVPSAGLNLAIVYSVARVAVSGSVLTSGNSALAGARITIESSDAIAAAANVTIGGSTLVASGRVSRVVTSDSSGALPALQLPAGAYVVTVEPPTGASDGLTTFQTTAPGTWNLTLQPPVSLSGKVTDMAGHAVVGARVTATALSGLGAAPYATTDSGGVYTIPVGAGTASNVRVEPLAAAKLSDATVFVAAGAAKADITLSPGLQIVGLVTSSSSAIVPLALVEAMCWDCATPTILKTAVSDGSGNYKLYLPDPGQRVVVDGGAN